MVVFFGGCGPQQGESRSFVNTDLTTKKHASHRKHVWTGPWWYFVEAVAHTKSSLDRSYHPSIISREQQTMPTTANICGLGHGSILLNCVGLTKASVDQRSIMILGQKSMPGTANMSG